MSVKTAILVGTLALASLPIAGASHAAGRGSGLVGYFPSSHQYPAAYHALPVRTYRQAANVFAGMNSQLAARQHFVLGATQTALGSEVVVTVTLARFRTRDAAQSFLRSVHPDVVKDGTQVSTVLRNLGTGGGQSISGGCASCGPTAPALEQVFSSRGTMFVEFGVQPANLKLAKRLASIVDVKLHHAKGG